ncbi:hypothetical protein UlMin_024259 [Ulmus minor]
MENSPQPVPKISTEDIQKCLEENKQLIMAIMENQNMGKFNDCAPHRERLQKNLTYLSRLADQQPQIPTQPTPQQGHYLQHPVAAMPPSQHQQPASAERLPFQLSNEQQQQMQHYFQQQQLAQAQAQAQMGMMKQNMPIGGGSQMRETMVGKEQRGLGTGAVDFLGNSLSGYNNGDKE